MRHEENVLQQLRDEGRDVLSLSEKEKPSIRAHRAVA
jgi:hypothetical protein